MPRVSESLNQTLRSLLRDDPRTFVLGEDIADPYGGAFGVTSGLTTDFPDRVLSTPISEAGFTGVANGLALCGDTVIVELMFADFATLAFDQIVNFAAKAVSMYGAPVPMRMVVRLPSGGRRGYGATHSQSIHKHFIGVPGLSVYELSVLHDSRDVFARMIASERPCLFVEDKSLYGRRIPADGEVDDLFSYDFLDSGHDWARAYVGSPDAGDHLLLVVPGGMFYRALGAARRLLLENELTCQIVVPSRLYPLDPEPLVSLVERAERICVAEEASAGGTWGADVSALLYARMWDAVRRPIRTVHSADCAIPSAAHLEERVLVHEDDIVDALLGESRA